MSNNRDHEKHKRNDHVLKHLPAEVLLKARSTLFNLGGALKHKHEQQHRLKPTPKDAKEKKKELKTSRSEPEFSDLRQNKHRSRVDEPARKEHSGTRPRPLSVGANKRYDRDTDCTSASYPTEPSPLRQRNFESSEDFCVHSRLVIPVAERLINQDIQVNEVTEKPRKKLSFREPEIISSGSATLERSHKLMGVNSLTKRPNRYSLRSEPQYSSLEGLDSDLESQAMRIVRTVGQAFEVCHKMQIKSSDQPAPSTSSALDEPAVASQVAPSKEAASDCGASELGASTSKAGLEEEGVEPRTVSAAVEEPSRLQHMELLPPPPRNNAKRSSQRTSPAPTINLPELPECVTRVDIGSVDGDAVTPLSAQHQLQLLRERLEQQAQQTRAAVAQLLLLRDQLAAEQAARCEAQARTHQLLVHNKELLEHIAALVAHLQDKERGSSRPISAQHLTLLPQMKVDGATGAAQPENLVTCNGNSSHYTHKLIDLLAHTSKVTQSVENNNVQLSPYSASPNVPATPSAGATSTSSFGGMTHDQIQEYLISKFQIMEGYPNENNERCASLTKNLPFYQNRNTLPSIPLLTNQHNNLDLSSSMNRQAYQERGKSLEETQPMSVGYSEVSLCSTSQATTSKDSTPDAFSSDDGAPFIMPLSHKGTLTATGEDGRVRLIVPVSPSGSSSEVPMLQVESPSSSGPTLKVPNDKNLLSVTPAGSITRSTSEKFPNRSELMTAMRSQWTRHTTK